MSSTIILDLMRNWGKMVINNNEVAMYFNEERINEILEILKRDGKVLVKQLSKQFHVSEDMIRKDLQKLQNTGQLQRTYGGAMAISRNSSDSKPFSSRISIDTECKRKIAANAYKLIPDHSTVLIDVSSSNYYLAEIIAASNRPINLITNMPAIAALFTENCSTELYILGGKFHGKIGATFGATTINAAQEYSFDYAFIGCCGIDDKSGAVYNFDPEEGRTKKACIAASRKSFLLAESSKFLTDGVYRFANLTSFDAIISDETLPQHITTLLDELSISYYY